MEEEKETLHLPDVCERLTIAIKVFEAEMRKADGYMPSISTMLRMYADEMAEKYPDDVNGGLPSFM